MKAILIAATSLALVHTALAQTTETPATGNPTVDPTEMPAPTSRQEAADTVMQFSRDMGRVMGTAGDGSAARAADAAHEAATAAEEAIDSEQEAIVAASENVAPPDVAAPHLSPAEPGMLGSWLVSRRIWSSHAPADDTPLVRPPTGELAERPDHWQDIARIDDIVLDAQGSLAGYVVDIGGFLGIGARKVLLGTDAVQLIRAGGSWLFVTGFTQAELEALPAFDAANMLR